MNFVQWRNLHKITQQQISDEAKVSVTSVIKYERDESLRSDTKAKIEKYINSVDGGVYLAQKKDYRPKSIFVDDIWQYIPKEYSFIAKDKNDLVYLHENKPTVERATGVWSSDSMQRLPLNVDFGLVFDWTECCFERPYNYWDYIGKIGIFSSVDKPEYTILGKLTSIDLDSKAPFQKDSGLYYSNFRPLTEMEKNELA